MKKYIVALSLALTSCLSFAGTQGDALSDFEMAAINGAGTAQFSTKASKTEINQWERFHSHKATVAPGFHSWHSITDGSYLQMMCKSLTTGQVKTYLTGSFRGNVTLVCPS